MSEKQKIEEEICCVRADIDKKGKELAEYIKKQTILSNRLSNFAKSLTESVKEFPLAALDRERYIELLLLENEIGMLEFAKSIDNNWWTINYLMFYGRAQIEYHRLLKEQMETTIKAIANLEEFLAELRSYNEFLSSQLN